MNVSDLIDPSFSYRLIATLIHFLWQGCLVALVTIPAEWLLRHAPASRRYALHVTAMTIMVAYVAVTFFQIELPVSDPATSAESAGITPVTDVIPSNPGAAAPADLHQTLPPSFVGVETSLPEMPSVAAAPEPVVPPNVREEHSIVNGNLWRGFQRWTPQIALSYFACCVLMLARLARGTWVAHRLRTTATTVSDESIIAMLHRQSKQLGLRVIPRVAWCAEVSIPLVIGIFKPMILLPAAAATGLSPDQLQALITHELAHIRRYDLLVNLLQRIVESMLFFHPAVWYVSRRISSEREHACDEMVLETGCERLRYADALVRMAELSTSMRRPGQSAPATSLAAAGANSSEFKRRVLKVLSVPTSSQLRPSRIALLVVLTLILGAALFASRRNFSALADAPPAPTETETTPPVVLEFLKPYPKLHGLSLEMTESQFLKIIKEQDLRSRKSAEAGKVTHRIALGDDHTLIVMFDKDGKCGGIQRVRGEDKASDEPASVLKRPQGKESQLLFQKWQRTARTSGDIPGGSIGPLVRVMTNFVTNNPTHEGSPKFAELLKRIDVTRDWSHDETVKLLDEVTVIYPSLPEWVEDEPRFTLGGDVVAGKTLPEELKDAPWGEAQPNGLRAAWLLEPRGNEHRLNTALKSRVLFHNSGKNAVVFRALTWNQSGEHKAYDAQGQAININSTWWTTIPRTFVCRLAPGEFIEVIGAGIGVGPNKDDEDWRDARSDVRVGSWIEAKVGDDVTFTPAAIDGDGRESARSDDDEAPSTPKSWWLKFIKDRLSLDAPLPADANERGRLLDLAVRDLFGNAPTNDELAEFKKDLTPAALDALAKRLAERTGFETFSGMLTSGPTKFKVLPVDPDAAKKPRSAKGPGRYPLGGNVTFVVTRRPIGERIVNEARLDFAPTDATKPAPRESHPVPLPDGYDSWIAAWMRGGTVLWVAQIDTDQKTSIRRYDFTNPVSVLETVITELKPGETLPEAILDVFSAHFQRVRGEDKNGADSGAMVARPKSTGTNEAEKELASFQGTWCFDVLQIADWPQPIGIGTDSNGRRSEKRMVVKGNQISWTDRQGNAIVAEFTIDPLQTPKQIDFTFLTGPNRGAKSIGIYEPQRGNDAYRWLCMTHPGSDAPRPIDVSASSLKKQSMIGMYQVAPPEKPSNARALERFQGVWNITLCDSALPTFGATQQEASKWQWTVRGDEVLWNRQGEVWKLKLDVDTSKRPREINLTYLSGPFQGEKCLGMYEFGGVDEQCFNISIQDPGANVPRPKAIEMRSSGKTSLIFLRPEKPSDVERQIGAFQGTWTLRNFDTGKNNESTSWPLPKGKGPDKSGEGSELRWVVKGNEITWVSPDGQEIKASFTFDPQKRPKQIDLTFLSGPDKGETCSGIYQRGDLDENILWLCMADPKSKSVRPQNFSYQFGEGRSVLSLINSSAP